MYIFIQEIVGLSHIFLCLRQSFLNCHQEHMVRRVPAKHSLPQAFLYDYLRQPRIEWALQGKWGRFCELLAKTPWCAETNTGRFRGNRPKLRYGAQNRKARGVRTSCEKKCTFVIEKKNVLYVLEGTSVFGLCLIPRLTISRKLIYVKVS